MEEGRLLRGETEQVPVLARHRRGPGRRGEPVVAHLDLHAAGIAGRIQIPYRPQRQLVRTGRPVAGIGIRRHGVAIAVEVLAHGDVREALCRAPRGRPGPRPAQRLPIISRSGTSTASSAYPSGTGTEHSAPSTLARQGPSGPPACVEGALIAPRFSATLRTPGQLLHHHPTLYRRVIQSVSYERRRC